MMVLITSRFSHWETYPENVFIGLLVGVVVDLPIVGGSESESDGLPHLLVLCWVPTPS